MFLVKVSINLLNTECWDPQLFPLYHKHFQKIPCKEWIKETKLADQYIFLQTSKTEDSYKTYKMRMGDYFLEKICWGEDMSLSL